MAVFESGRGNGRCQASLSAKARSQAELFRWLIDYGLAALDSGVKPEIEVVDARGEAKKSHWTSQ